MITERDRLKRLAAKSRIARTTASLAVLSLFILGLSIANRLFPGKVQVESRSPREISTTLPASDLVERIVDGDTLILACGQCVRLKGIDTPEQDQAGYAEAGNALRTLVEGQKVTLSFDDHEKTDTYGRLLAFLSTPSCDSVNRALIANGWAWIYRLAWNSPERDSFLAAQQNAIQARIGIWSELGNGRGPYIGSQSSHIFHKADCPNGRKISQKNLYRFELLREAFLQGYSPCRKCFAHPLDGR
ncbi:MAG: thermonuclease family protein [Planctomycetota bacterium]